MQALDQKFGGRFSYCLLAGLSFSGAFLVPALFALRLFRTSYVAVGILGGAGAGLATGLLELIQAGREAGDALRDFGVRAVARGGKMGVVILGGGVAVVLTLVVGLTHFTSKLIFPRQTRPVLSVLHATVPGVPGGLLSTHILVSSVIIVLRRAPDAERESLSVPDDADLPGQRARRHPAVAQWLNRPAASHSEVSATS